MVRVGWFWVALFVGGCGSTETESSPNDGGSGAAGNGASGSGGSTGTGGTAGGSAGSSGAAGSSGGAGSGGDVCKLPKEAGPCEAEIPRWWFNSATDKCEPFVYGGCQGNANNFESAQACVQACAHDVSNACDVIACEQGAICAFAAALPLCAAPCSNGGKCPAGQDCECGASCPNCKDCVQVCLPG
jgi:hypothetical protein